MVRDTRSEYLSRIKDAACYLRMVWQGHDEFDKKMCGTGATNLYFLQSDSLLEDLVEAGELVVAAFWKSDEAEKYMGVKESREKELYLEAGELLKKSRELAGLETESTHYTALWWRDYRHKDKDSLIKNLTKEQELQLGFKKDGRTCALLLLEAATKHKEKDWEAVEDKLQEYFNVFFGYNLNKEELFLSKKD